MFFCESCKHKNNWPGFMKVSYGNCEVCNKVDGCYDVPSSALPMPKRVVKPEYVGKHRKDA